MNPIRPMSLFRQTLIVLPISRKKLHRQTFQLLRLCRAQPHRPHVRPPNCPHFCNFQLLAHKLDISSTSSASCLEEGPSVSSAHILQLGDDGTSDSTETRFASEDGDVEGVFDVQRSARQSITSLEKLGRDIVSVDMVFNYDRKVSRAV